MFKRLFHRPLMPSLAPPQASSPSRALPYTRLSLSDWRASGERVAYVHDLLKQPLFLDLLGMLANIRPLSTGDLSATAAAKLLGQREGHDQVIASLLAAATSPPAPPADIPLDYGAANVQALWEGKDEEGEV